MTGQPALTRSPYAEACESVPNAHAGRLTRALVRLAWVALALSILGLNVASIPVLFHTARTMCLGSACGQFQAFALNQPVAEEVAELERYVFTVEQYALYQILFFLLGDLVCLVLGALLFWYPTQNRTARVMAFAFLLWALPPADAVHRALPGFQTPAFDALVFGSHDVAWMLMFYLFPDGRFALRWTVPLAAGYALLVAGGMLYPASYLNQALWPGWLSFAFGGLVFGAAIASQVYKYRRISSPVLRRQARWVVFALAAFIPLAVALLVLSSLPSLREPGLARLLFYPPLTLIVIALYVTFGVAILRHHLWDIRIILNRSLVYIALSALVVTFYVLIVGGLGVLLHAQGSLLVSLVGTGLVAVVLQPLRNVLQRGVNRLMYGERDDPYTVLSRLGRRLEQALIPEHTLDTLVSTVYEALKLSYAGVALKDDGSGGFLLVSEAGVPAARPLVLPLSYQNEVIGELRLGLRQGEPSTAELRLLGDLARQASVAVHAVRLATALQRSRTRLVASREEERSRLRRDLHDGLGPALVTQMLRLEVARDIALTDPERTSAMLSELRQDMQGAIQEIRRVVYGLRPPTLDEFGLLSALREQVRQYEHDGLCISLEIPRELPSLPAAVEVAAYRIVQEALTNVVRHARATACTVSIVMAGGLSLLIRDNGCGLPPDQPAGVGLTSMRERAEELGGTCSAGMAPGGGTVVTAHLPCCLS